ncbi:MAG: hypothetical protein R3D67_02980 [Hyphomicrobiaceae bacterium]
MPSTIIWFATDEFEDTDEDRLARINEEIGGAALAKWLSAELQARGLKASVPWAEDHGWDFDISDEGARYTIVCTIEDAPDGEREACVQIHKGRPSASPLEQTERVLQTVVELIEGRGAAIRID